ncbi:hypothetical protein [Rhizobium populisoli]|nr:hypothetical protein [Rhizobium populisoli]
MVLSIFLRFKGRRNQNPWQHLTLKRAADGRSQYSHD